MASSPQQSNDQQQFDPKAFMSNFDPELIHRVLLTDPSDYSKLTMSGQPRLADTPAYDEKFLLDNGFIEQTSSPTGAATGANTNVDVATQISRTMKKAFHESLVRAIESRPADIADLKSLMLELHQKMRGLVPSRTDLHSILSDEEVNEMTLGAADGGDGDEGGSSSGTNSNDASDKNIVLPRLIKSAQALVQLESEDRSVTTRSWIEMATNVLSSTITSKLPFDTSPASFVVSSLAYLHAKVDLCASDIQDYHLSTVLAPRIAMHGPHYERTIFEQQFGPFYSDDTAPITRQWIQRTIEECGISRQELLSSEEHRVTALHTSGWVNLILFQTIRAMNNEGDDSIDDIEGDAHNKPAASEGASQSEPFIRVPEVLQSDIANLRAIRNTTRMSVIGSALALHACNVAGVGDAVLRREPSTAEINRCRENLVKAMSDMNVPSQEAFEKGIASAVIDLARVLKPSMGSAEENILLSKTPAVMRGEDPVIKLLDNRMRLVFCDMMSWVPTETRDRVPLRMATGRPLSVPASEGQSPTTFSSLFLAAAKQKFMQRGFAFYATELAEASLTTTKVINLVFVV